MEHFDLLHGECGFVKPYAKLDMEDKDQMVHALTLQFGLLQSKAEIDQYMEGLKSLGVLDAIVQYHDLLKPFFCLDTSESKVTAGSCTGCIWWCSIIV